MVMTAMPPRFESVITSGMVASIPERVYRQLRAQGTPIPTNDMWIAALVLQPNLVLYVRDRHFDHLPQIARI